MGRFKNQFVDNGMEHLQMVEERKIIDNGRKGLKFDNRLHQYVLNGVVLLSGTELIKRYVRPFEKTYISSLTANKNKKKGMGKLTTGEEVRRYWNTKAERKSALGTSLHAFCEAYWLNPEEIKPVHPIEENAKKLMDSLMRQFIITNMEVNRGNKDYKIGYTIDIELQHKVTGKYYIGDFKFSETFTAEQYKKIKNRQANYLLDPFRTMKLRDTTEDKGYIQLNLYKRLFELDTNIKIEGMFLFHIDGTGHINWYEDKGYKAYTVPNLQKQIDIILKPHKSIKYNVMNKL